MLEDPNCTRCQLHQKCATVCLQGRGNPDSASLAIFLDQPSYMDDIRGKSFVSDGAELLFHLLARMGLNVVEDVYLDYVLKCGAGKMVPKQKRDRLVCYEACSYYRFATLQNMPNLKAVVVMGRYALEAFIGASDIGDYESENWTPKELEVRMRVPHIWVAYSINYLLEKPAETPATYRILWKAAEEAGLQPTLSKVTPYVWNL